MIIANIHLLTLDGLDILNLLVLVLTAFLVIHVSVAIQLMIRIYVKIIHTMIKQKKLS